jgi:hypothetical protein
MYTVLFLKATKFSKDDRRVYFHLHHKSQYFSQNRKELYFLMRYNVHGIEKINRSWKFNSANIKARHLA